MSAPAPTPAAPPKPDLVTVTIDGRDIAVPKGTNVVEAAKLLGIEIPHYCYHPKLTVAGNCRMCLVEMGLPAVDPATKSPVMDPATGRQRINWMPRPTIACATAASPGLQIRTDSKLARECREGVMEFLLVNHPLDCPICDQAGECTLQEFAFDYGRGQSRFVEQKNVKPKRTRLGPRVTLDDERCILCSRCIRFSREVAKDDVLGFIDRGSHSTLTCHPGKELANNYSLNTVDICPVGALTSTDFRFKMRVWFLKQTESICTESSAGANTTVWSREGKIYRITPRRNDAVNDCWMTDSGREIYKLQDSPDRLTRFQIGGRAVEPDAALAEAARLLQTGAVAIVASGRNSVEEHFLLARIAASLPGTSAELVPHRGPGDGLLLTEDRSPNTRGALVTGLVAAPPSPERIASLGARIDAGEVRVLIVAGEELQLAGLGEARLARVTIVYLGTHAHATSAAARVVLPGAMVFEKDGCFINQQFRLQRFRAAVPAPGQARADTAILADLANRLQPGAAATDLAGLWSQIASAIPALSGLSHAALPETGAALDGTAFASLPFPESASLHYLPPARA